MPKIPTKEEVLSAVVTTYYDDLEFIEALNNLTYGRKVQLKAQLRNQPNQQLNDESNQ